MENNHKSDKELAVDLVNTYIGVWFSKSVKPISGDEIKSLIKVAYQAIHELKE